MKKLINFSMLFLIMLWACSDNTLTTESGITYEILKAGAGPVPQQGQVVSLHYTGMLLDGKKFDSSYDREQPFNVIVGVRNVIKGLDEILLTMNEGSRWLLTIPPKLAYKDKEHENIPPNSTLKFDVEILDVIDEEYETESGIRYTIIQKGSGPVPKMGQTCAMHYNVWLPGWEKLDSSFYSGKPFMVTIGKTAVIDGWLEVLSIMPAGSQWKVTIPSRLAYGEAGFDPIPPNTDLTFEMYLGNVQ